MPDFNRTITAGETVTRVLKSLGLPVPTGSIVGSTDATSRQMWALLTELGQDILDEHDWQILGKTQLLTTTAALEYDLPSDLHSYTDAAQWNRTARIPLIGPVNEQIWQMLEARQLGGTTLRLQYKIENDKLVFYFTPSAGQQLALSYRSRAWVRDGSVPTTFRDYPANDGDVILFDPRLMISGLKLYWRREKGFDTGLNQAEYDKRLAEAKYNDKPKSDLGISGRSGFPYLGYSNMPDTSYGG